MIKDILLDKNIFTGIIVTLYILNFLYQIFFTKDFLWGMYWFSAAMITISATMMSLR